MQSWAFDRKYDISWVILNGSGIAHVNFTLSTQKHFIDIKFSFGNQDYLRPRRDSERSR